MSNDFKEYADAAGLMERDMPSPHHPLLENDDEVNTLADLVDVRSESSQNLLNEHGSAAPNDEDAYMGRQDFLDSMLSSDPDENDGIDEDETLGGSDLTRAPDMTGTVMGLARGTATHLPQDIGAGGFQIEEIDQIAPDAASEVSTADSGEDGGRIPVAAHKLKASDDAVEAVRTLV